jgi:hypothetical protein
VEIDQKVIETLVSLIRRRYPNWSSFDDEAYVADERSVKLATIDKAIGPDGLLTEAALRDDLDGRAYESFIQRLIAIGKDVPLQFLAVPSASDLNVLYEPPGNRRRRRPRQAGPADSSSAPVWSSQMTPRPIP